MGYEIHLTNTSALFLTNCVDMDARLTLKGYWETVSIKHAALQSLYYHQVAEDRCAQLLRHTAINRDLKPAEDKGHNPNIFTISTSDFNWSIEIHVRLRNGIVETKYCTSCGVRVPENHDYGGLGYTRAHNVIPSRAWKHIIPRALQRLLADIAEPPTVRKAYLEMGFLMESAKRGSTPEYEDPDWVDHGVDKSPAGMKIRAKFQPDDWDTMRLLRMTGEKANGPGATPYEGAQCGICEKVHASLSLIQRLMVAQTYKSLERNMVADTFRTDPSPGAVPRTPMQIAVVHTERVARRVLDDMLQAVDNNQKGWLAKTLLTYWGRWQGYVSAEAVAICSEPVDAAKEQERVVQMGRKKA